MLLGAAHSCILLDLIYVHIWMMDAFGCWMLSIGKAFVPFSVVLYESVKAHKSLIRWAICPRRCPAFPVFSIREYFAFFKWEEWRLEHVGTSRQQNAEGSSLVHPFGSQ